MVPRSLAKTSPRTRAARARSLATRTTRPPTRHEPTPHSRTATPDLVHQDRQRDHRARVAHERGPLADPEPQEASVSQERLAGGIHSPPRQRDPSSGLGRTSYLVAGAT